MKLDVMSLTSHKVELAYFDLPGSGIDKPTLVMLHGLGASAQSTFGHVATFAELNEYRRLLIDLPGFGQSTAAADWSATIEGYADVVASFLDQLGLSSVALVGHSMGGSIAVALTTRRPDLVGRLIVAEPNLDANTGLFSGQIVRSSEEVFLSRSREAILRSIHIAAKPNDANTAVFAATVASASPQILYRSAVSLRAERTPSFRQQLAAITVPRLYISGETSDEATASELTSIGVAFAEIRGAGHVMMADDPDAFVRIVSVFLESSYS